MNEVDQYIIDSIKTRVWGGFDSEDDIQEMITDILEDGANEKMLREFVRKELQIKKNAEKNWPDVTDFDCLEKVYDSLKKQGILCLHDAGYTMSDGHDDANEAIESYPDGTFYGYCFYHGQDLERAVTGSGLMLAYDHVDGDAPDKLKVALTIKDALIKSGFEIEWDGTTNQRINIPKFDWKHRTESGR